MSNDISYVIKVADDFSATLRKYQSQMAAVDVAAKKSSQTFKEAGTSSKFFTQNLVDLGKATGIYFGAREVLNFGKGIFQARVEMDGLQASLAAIMPKFDKTKSGTQLAAEEIDYLRAAADRMGISFQAAAPEYMKFLASSKTDLPTARKTFEAFSGLSRLYGLSASRFSLVINALQQMQGKGVVNMEELKLQLGDSLPNAMNLFAEAAGVSTKEFYNLVQQGRVGSGILTKVAENIEKKFGKDMVAAAQTLGGRTAVLGNQWYYLKTVLSDQVAPVLSDTISDLLKLTAGLASVFSAIDNQTAFSKLSDGLQATVMLLRFAKGFLHGVYEEIKLIKDILGFVPAVATNVVTAGVLGGKALAGTAQATRGALWGGKYGLGGDDIQEGKRSMNEAGSALGLLWGETKALFSPKEPQKVEVVIKMEGAPTGTTAEVKQNSSKKTSLRTGNSVQGGDQ